VFTNLSGNGHRRVQGRVEIQVSPACEWRISALPVLTYEKYAALRFSKSTILGAA
jgi:hypothetical protein